MQSGNKSIDPTEDISKWEDINLLLSWERQGLFWQSPRSVFINDFVIPAENLDDDLVFTINWKCDILDIYLNEKRIVGDISNGFDWGDPADLKAEKVFPLSKKILNSEGKNRLKIIASNFSYSAGKSFNYCSVSPKNSQSKSEISISFPNTDHLYLENDKPELELNYIAEKDGKITLNITSDFHENLYSEEFVAQKGKNTIIVDLSKENLKPGIYECVAILHDIGFTGTAQWFTITPEKIQCNNTKPEEFDAYWQKLLQELAKVKPEFNMYKVDSLQSETRDGYIVEMKSLDNVTIRGYYFVPKAPVKYAAVLHLPGMGYGFQHHATYLANKENVVELAICVRNHGIAEEVMPVWGIPGQWGTNICKPEEYAYRGIFMDCVRALEFLENRPEVDNSRIGCDGGSQGGGLTLMLAGLCPERIGAAAYFDPFPCDVRDAIHIRTIMQREIQNFVNYYKDCDWDTAFRTIDMHDAKHFAENIKCPVYYSAGLFDDDCPAHLGFAAYNTITSDKRYKVQPGDSHLGESNYQKAFMDFFKVVFGY